MSVADPPVGHPRLVKLVRDRVHGVLADAGVEFHRIEDGDQYLAALRKKLVEEAAEYLLNPSLDELADIYETILTLAKRDLGVPFTHVIDECNAKDAERGGFSGAMGMWVTSTAGPRHEGEHAA